MTVKHPIAAVVMVCLCMMFASGCSTHHVQNVGLVSMHQAEVELPEDQLLDVGITVFRPGELTTEKAVKEGTSSDTREAERHFIPYHLKNTLQRSSHWGAVRVLPVQTGAVDLVVQGEIMQSNGEKLAVNITVKDASGHVWFAAAL